MPAPIDIVPKWLRIVVGALAIANIILAIMSYFDISLLFYHANGIDMSNTFIKLASYKFAARGLAIGLALGIVALKGVPESITIVIIIRALIEAQIIIMRLVTHQVEAVIALPLVFLAIELFIIITLVGIIRKRNATQ